MVTLGRTAVAAAGALAVALSPVTAQAAAPASIDQGIAVLIEGHGTCTLGYNDHDRGRSYLAGHCGSDGARVRLINRKTNEMTRALGTFHPSPNYHTWGSNDWGWIEWDDGVRMGENVYSGDKILSRGEVKAGDQVCSHGETSQMGTKETDCGTFTGWAYESFGVRDVRWAPGDSGGPVFVPGRGFVGVMSAAPDGEDGGVTAYYGSRKVKGEWVGWGAAPRDGKSMDDQEFTLKYAEAAGLDVNGVGGSSLSTLSIISIVLSIIAALAPVAAQLAQQFMP